MNANKHKLNLVPEYTFSALYMNKFPNSARTTGKL